MKIDPKAPNRFAADISIRIHQFKQFFCFGPGEKWSIE